MDQDKSFERIQTKSYEGRQRYAQDMAHLVLERRDRIARMAQRDGRLILAVAILSVLVGMCVLLIVVLSRTGVRTEVQVVRIDQFGNEQPLIKLSELPATPEQLTLIDKLQEWTTKVRTITPDGRIMNYAWKWLEDFTAQALLNRLEPYRKEQMQRQQSGVHVHITQPTVQRLASPRSFQVQWDECTTSVEGRLILEQTAVWKATVTVADFQTAAVKNARDLRIKNKNYRNLQAIVVEDVEWKAQPFLKLQDAEARCAKS